MLTVSVLIPCYNAAQTLSEAINGLKLQIFTNYEVIAVKEADVEVAEVEVAEVPITEVAVAEVIEVEIAEVEVAEFDTPAVETTEPTEVA